MSVYTAPGLAPANRRVSHRTRAQTTSAVCFTRAELALPSRDARQSHPAILTVNQYHGVDREIFRAICTAGSRSTCSEACDSSSEASSESRSLAGGPNSANPGQTTGQKAAKHRDVPLRQGERPHSRRPQPSKEARKDRGRRSKHTRNPHSLAPGRALHGSLPQIAQLENASSVAVHQSYRINV